MLSSPLPALDDEEGESTPADLPPVIDAHVHLFPTPLFEAIWRWFDQHGWPIRYRLHAEAVIEHLRRRGVRHVLGLMYAHKAGMSRGLNAWMADLSRSRADVTGFATVLPGEPGAAAILDEAFDQGLWGVKLHCHVQCFAVDDPVLRPLYELCEARGRPMVIHAGREPKSPAYACDPHALCDVSRVERVLAAHPRLRLCVPHLGIDEVRGYGRLLERYDNLFLDTTMTLSRYFPNDDSDCWELVRARPDRILYGTDFPNIPYAWDRELKLLAAEKLSAEALTGLLGKNAAAFLGLSYESLIGSGAG